MNKQDYLAALEKALKSAGVRDFGDIIEEYSEHFDMKTADGFSEEEIAAKLARPEELAAQFKEAVSEGPAKKGAVVARIFKACGVVIMDMAVVPTMIAFYAWVFTLYVISFANALAGIVLVTGIANSGFVQAHQYIHIPPMPVAVALLIGITVLGLAVLAGIGAEYCRQYVTQMWRKYMRWHRNVLTSGPKSPPLPLSPQVAPKKRRVMRTLTFIALLVFGVGLVAGMVTMILMTGSFEPWHAWGWFV